MIQGNLILFEMFSLDKNFSSWCCKNGNPVTMKVITTTFIRWEPTGQTQAVVTGHDKCGFGGWSTCTVYGIQHV
jgi:hypothetical protein